MLYNGTFLQVLIFIFVGLTLFLGYVVYFARSFIMYVYISCFIYFDCIANIFLFSGLVRHTGSFTKRADWIYYGRNICWFGSQEPSLPQSALYFIAGFSVLACHDPILTGTLESPLRQLFCYYGICAKFFEGREDTPVHNGHPLFTLS
jgi:hypothetical protein